MSVHRRNGMCSLDRASIQSQLRTEHGLASSNEYRFVRGSSVVRRVSWDGANSIVEYQRSVPSLVPDDGTMSDNTSIATDNESAEDTVSSSGQSLSSVHPAFPSNLANEQGRARLSNAALLCNDISGSDGLIFSDSSTQSVDGSVANTTRNVSEGFLDAHHDAWTPFAPSRAERIVDARSVIPAKLQQALQGLEGPLGDAGDASAEPLGGHYALEAWLRSEDDPWTHLNALRHG